MGDGETQTGQAATVAWTVSLTMVLMCDVGAAAASLYSNGRPEAHSVAVFCELLLFAGAVIGALSLAMIPVVYRVRRTPPPPAIVAFAACIAAAPILAVMIRMLG